MVVEAKDLGVELWKPDKPSCRWKIQSMPGSSGGGWMWVWYVKKFFGQEDKSKVWAPHINWIYYLYVERWPRLKALPRKRVGGKRLRGSNLTLSAKKRDQVKKYMERWLSWLKARDWKSRNRIQMRFEGSNPSLSAIMKIKKGYKFQACNPFTCFFFLDLRCGI